jgi:hypothetical protein
LPWPQFGLQLWVKKPPVPLPVPDQRDQCSPTIVAAPSLTIGLKCDGLTELDSEPPRRCGTGDAAGPRDQFALLLPVRERVLGKDHPGTLAARADLARWTAQAGDVLGEEIDGS